MNLFALVSVVVLRCLLLKLKGTSLYFCRCICLLSRLIFLSLSEKATKNSQVWQSARNWGCEYTLQAFSSPYLQTLHHLFFPCSYWYVFFKNLCTNSKRQTQKSKEQQKNSRCNFLPITPWLRIHIFAMFFLFIFLSFSIICMIVSEVRYIVCDVSTQSSCHQPPVSTY